MPDVRSPGFRAAAHRQSLAVAGSAHVRDDQAFIDAVSGWGATEASCVRRGDIWIVSGGGDDAGTPCPVVCVQDGSFDATESITICAFTTDPTDAPLFRLAAEPNGHKGLCAPSRLMVDKITTVSKAKVGERIGRLGDEDVVLLNQAVAVFLGLAVLPRTGRKEG